MKKILLFIFFTFFLLNESLYSGTIITAPAEVTGAGTDEIASQIQDFSDNFGPAMANAYAIGNVAGYPVGSATLGSLPSFLLGFSLNAGFANMDYFDDDVSRPKELYPAVGLNPALFFGMGLTDRLDVIAKFAVYSDGLYRPPLNNEKATLEKLSLYSAGGKVRYNIVKGKKLLPGIFNFGGVTLSAGGDFMYGKIGLNGTVNYPLEGITVDFGPPAGEIVVDLEFNPSYTTSIKWFIAGGNVQAIVFFNFLWIFDMYTGLELAFTYGSFDLSLNGSGTAVYSNPPAPDETVAVALDSNNKYKPRYVLPLYVVGVDINLYYVHLTFETMVNLWNRKDVNGQLGFRLQY